MNTLALTETFEQPARKKGVVKLPYGLLGFERVKNYSLLANPEEGPFLWFQMLDDAKHSFLVLPPEEVMQDYQPDLDEEDVDFLGLEDPADALILNIVTVREFGQSTVNLKGPIVINRRTLIGKQVIPRNAAEYTVQHPLPV